MVHAACAAGSRLTCIKLPGLGECAQWPGAEHQVRIKHKPHPDKSDPAPLQSSKPSDLETVKYCEDAKLAKVNFSFGRLGRSWGGE